MGLWVNFKGSGGSGHPLHTLIGENNPDPNEYTNVTR